MKKQLFAAILSTAMILGMAGCGNTASSQTGSAAGSSTAAATADSGVSYTIGISQFAEHGSLDNCREGFLAGLAEEGIVEGENLTVLFDNAQADTGTASTISDNYVSKKVDLICAIATPSAMSAYNSALNTDIPVIYTAVSDPEAQAWPMRMVLL